MPSAAPRQGEFESFYVAMLHWRQVDSSCSLPRSGLDGEDQPPPARQQARFTQEVTGGTTHHPRSNSPPTAWASIRPRECGA